MGEQPARRDQTTGSFLARHVPQFMRLLESYRHDDYAPESFLSVHVLAEWLDTQRPADSEPGIMHGDCHLNNVLLRRRVPELAALGGLATRSELIEAYRDADGRPTSRLDWYVAMAFSSWRSSSKAPGRVTSPGRPVPRPANGCTPRRRT